MKKLKSKTKYIILLIAIFVAASFLAPQFYKSAEIIAINNIAPAVQIGDTIIFVEQAVTSAELEKGLSGRDGLPPHRGMLFVFSKPGLYRFWMPDMRFPLDMIWINNGVVVGISYNATADFNPAKPVYYTPPEPAQYVLEVNAGIAHANNIKIGDPVTFIRILPSR